MNMFARFDENPAMTLRVIKETKRYGRTDGRTDGRMDARTDGRTDNVKTVYPLQTKFAGGIIKKIIFRDINMLFVNSNLWFIILIPPLYFVLKMSAFYVCCIYLNALQTRFYYGSKHNEP